MIIRTVLSFGDEVESIRSFDVATVVYRNPKKKMIIPNVEKVFQENRESFLDYISEKRCCLFKIPKTFFFAVG
jgi:transcription-repair coupling factor (superfamily II helicase)